MGVLTAKIFQNNKKWKDALSTRSDESCFTESHLMVTKMPDYDDNTQISPDIKKTVFFIWFMDFGIWNWDSMTTSRITFLIMCDTTL